MNKPWPCGVELIAGPYTAESLLSIAERKEAEYRTLRQAHPPGTTNDERNNAYNVSEAALKCAAWMEANGYKELAHVGPFQSFFLKRGQKVRVKKGSVIHSTSAKIPSEGKQSVRDQVIVVHSADNGYINGYLDNGAQEINQGRVNWVGAGGYWRWTDINNVELLEEVEANPPARGIATNAAPKAQEAA